MTIIQEMRHNLDKVRLEDKIWTKEDNSAGKDTHFGKRRKQLYIEGKITFAQRKAVVLNRGQTFSK